MSGKQGNTSSPLCQPLQLESRWLVRARWVLSKGTAILCSIFVRIWEKELARVRGSVRSVGMTSIAAPAYTLAGQPFAGFFFFLHTCMWHE